MLAHELVHESPEGVDPHGYRQRRPLPRTDCLHHVQEVSDQILILERGPPRLYDTVCRD